MQRKPLGLSLTVPTAERENAATNAIAWRGALAEFEAARLALRRAPQGIARQGPFDRTLAAGRRCTEIVHGWLAQALEMERVTQPRMVLSLDIDGVLEDWLGDFTATSMTGAAALKLLQLGQVAVVLNTAHCREAVEQRARQFCLFGGVSAFGGATLDALFDREDRLVTEQADKQLDRVRTALRADPAIVLDSAHDSSVRASRVVEGELQPISGADARRLLDRLEIYELAFWVAPHHTDFVDRSIDKGMGLDRLRARLGLLSVPLSAMGDGACDVPMLKLAQLAFVPAATLPAYVPPRRQRLMRSRFLGAQALWDAACQMVPSAALQRDVMNQIHALALPGWFPEFLRQLPSPPRRLLPRLLAH